MCAIFGLGFQKGSMFNPKDIKEVVKKLLLSCEPRGTHATGIAIANEDEVTVVKHNIRASQFIRTKEFNESFDKHVKFTGDRENRPTTQIIGHCRFQTKGSHTNNDNNHPIVCDRVIGTHNGMIGNDDVLFKGYNIKRKAQVDSEIIFRMIESRLDRMKESMPEAIRATAEKLSGSFACGMIDVENPWMFWMLKGSSPLSVLHYPDIGVIAYSTSGHFVEHSIKCLNPVVFKSIELVRNQALGVNLLTSDKIKFALPDTYSKNGGCYHFC